MPCVGMLIFSAYLWSLAGRPLVWLEAHAAWGRTPPTWDGSVTAAAVAGRRYRASRLCDAGAPTAPSLCGVADGVRHRRRARGCPLLHVAATRVTGGAGLQATPQAVARRSARCKNEVGQGDGEGHEGVASMFISERIVPSGVRLSRSRTLVVRPAVVCAVLWLASVVCSAHEIGTTRVAIWIEADRYRAEIVTDAQALSEKLAAASGQQRGETLDADQLQQRLAGFKDLLSPKPGHATVRRGPCPACCRVLRHVLVLADGPLRQDSADRSDPG